MHIVFSSPSVSSDDCQLEDDPFMLTISAAVTTGLPNTVNCVPSANEVSVVPRTTTGSLQFDVSATFNPAMTGQSYTCTISNDVGSAGQIMCSILGRCFPFPFLVR